MDYASKTLQSYLDSANAHARQCLMLCLCLWNKNARHIMSTGKSIYIYIYKSSWPNFCICANACVNPCQIFVSVPMLVPNFCVRTYLCPCLIKSIGKAQAQSFRHGQFPGLQNPNLQLN